MQTPSNMPLEKSPRDLPKPFSLRVPPLVSDKRVSQLHAPAGVILSDIIRYHADKAQKQKDSSAEGLGAFADDVVVVDPDEITAAGP